MLDLPTVGSIEVNRWIMLAVAAAGLAAVSGVLAISPRFGARLLAGSVFRNEEKRNVTLARIGNYDIYAGAGVLHSAGIRAG